MSDSELQGELLQPFDPMLIDDSEVEADRVLRYAQKTRMGMSKEILKSGMPTDDDDRKFLLSVLRDMDRTALDSQKIDVERQGVENDRAAQDIVNRLATVRPNGLRISPEDAVDYVPEVDVSDLPEVEFDSRQKHIGLVKETSKEFLERVDSEES